MKEAIIQIVNTKDGIEEARDRMCMDSIPGHLLSMIITNPNGSYTIHHVFEKKSIHRDILPSQRLAEVYGLDSKEDIQTIDIDKSDWESIKQAASESSWIPKEHYFQNDWVADVCTYLKESKPKENFKFNVWPDGSWVCAEDMGAMPEDYSDDFFTLEVPTVVCEASYDCIDAYIQAKMPKFHK